MQLQPRRLLLPVFSAAAAVWLVGAQSQWGYEEQLIRVQVREEFGRTAPEIEREPPVVQALLLDYAGNQALVLKMRSALLKYPDLARRILPTYGDDPAFQDVLLRFGEPVLPVIGYFMDNSLPSLAWRAALERQIANLEHLYARGEGAPDAPAEPAAAAIENGSLAPLTPEERGRYAIAFLAKEGYGFLGQFVVGLDGGAHWLQTERVLEDVSAFLVGGVSDLEAKWRQGREIGSGDVAWAAVDVAALAASVKLVKALGSAGRGARGIHATAFSERVALLGSRVLARGGRIARIAAKLGAVPAAIYLMVRYPSLINATLGELAGWLGVSPWVVQFVGWFLGIWLLARLVQLALRPLSVLLRGLAWVTGRLGGGVRLRRAEVRSA